MPLGLTIATLDDLHQNFSDMVGEDSPPGTTDAQYKKRTRWFNKGREDIANRFFFTFLLTTNTLALTATNAGPYTLFADFTRAQNLKQIKGRSSGIDFTDPFEVNKNTLILSRNLTNGYYQVTFTNAPAADDTADVYYYATPTKLATGTDLVLVDGEATLFYALRWHFFLLGQYAKMQEVRDEYENRQAEISRMDGVSIAGGLTSQQNFEQAKHRTDERSFYTSPGRRNV